MSSREGQIGHHLSEREERTKARLADPWPIPPRLGDAGR